MVKKEEINNATTKEAFVLAVRYSWVFVRNVWRAINKFAHKFPWICVGITVTVCFVVCFVGISNARAERDRCNVELVRLQQRLGVINNSKT